MFIVRMPVLSEHVPGTKSGSDTGAWAFLRGVMSGTTFVPLDLCCILAGYEKLIGYEASVISRRLDVDVGVRGVVEILRYIQWMVLIVLGSYYRYKVSLCGGFELLCANFTSQQNY
jgi:hypothetical protein